MSNKIKKVTDHFSALKNSASAFAGAGFGMNAYQSQLERTRQAVEKVRQSATAMQKALNENPHKGLTSEGLDKKRQSALEAYDVAVKEADLEYKHLSFLEQRLTYEDKINQKKEEQNKTEEDSQRTTIQINDQISQTPSKLAMIKSVLSGIGSKAKSLLGSLARGINYLLTSVVGVKTGFNIAEMVKEGNRVVENANLMAVSFDAVTDEYGKVDMAASTYYKDALDFQNKMHEKMQLQIADLSQIQSTFNYMFSNQGMGQEISSRMSKNLTAMAQDLASLYNTTFEEEAQKIASGLTGMTKGLRLQGIDLSNDSLQQTLDTLGIDAKARSLSYANKELLRYITLWEQTNRAQGDFARTSNASANQIKMLQDQITQTGAMIGMIFSQAFANVLTYVRAIVMVIQNLVRFIGNLFHVDWNNTGIQSAIGTYGELGEEVDDISSGIGGATKKAKEFKKQLMGFDEINNITPETPTSGGGGGGGGGVGDITDQLMKAIDLRDWDNQMESIRDKAQEYADAIMNALGFTKKLNGEWDWNIKNVNPFVKALVGGIVTIGGIIGGAKLKGLISSIKEFFGITSGTGAGVGSSMGAFATALQWILAISAAIFDIFVYSKAINKSWGGLKKRAEEVGTALGKRLSDIKNKLLTFLQDIRNKYSLSEILFNFELGGDIFSGIKRAFDTGFLDIIGTFHEFSKEIKEVLYENIYETVAELVVDITGLFSYDLAKGLADFFEVETKLFRKADDDYKSFKKSLESTAKVYENQISSLQATSYETEAYCRALEQVVDSDGKVKKGKEDLVDYILNELSEATGQEYIRKEDQIYLDGKLVNSTDEVRNAISELIEKQKEEIKTEELRAKLKAVISKKAEVYADILELEAEKLANGNQLSTEKEDKLKALRKEYNLLDQDVSAAADDIALNTANSLNTIDTNLVTSYHLMVETSDETSKVLKKNAKENWSNWKETYNNIHGKTVEETRFYKAKMLALTTDTEDMSEDIQKEWQELSSNNAQLFKESLQEIDEENRLKLLDVIKVTNQNAPLLAEAYTELGEGAITNFSNKLDDLDDATMKEIYKAMQEAHPDKGAGSQFVKQMAILGESGAKGFDDWLDDPNNGLEASTVQAIKDARAELRGSGDSIYADGKYIGSRLRDGALAQKIDMAKNLSFDYGSAWRLGNDIKNTVSKGIGTIRVNAALQLVNNSVLEGFKAIARANGFASGGFPTKGQFFVAREAGPELVGNIGSRSAVMNNMQIVAAVSGGVARAVSSVLSSGGFTMTLPELPQNNFSNDPQMASSIADAVISGLREQPLTADVNINAHTDKSVIFEEAANGIQEYTNRTGELPFSIPI